MQIAFNSQRLLDLQIRDHYTKIPCVVADVNHFDFFSFSSKTSLNSFQFSWKQKINHPNREALENSVYSFFGPPPITSTECVNKSPTTKSDLFRQNFKLCKKSVAWKINRKILSLHAKMKITNQKMIN